MSEYLRHYLGTGRKETQLGKEIRFKTSFHNTVYDVLRFRGYKETESELDWDIYWCDKEWIHDNLDHIHLQPHQKVNHFRNHFELTRKDLLVKHIKRAKKNCEKNNVDSEAYSNIMPTTFVLPQEYSMFVEEFKRSGKLAGGSRHWIMKPVGKAQGKGIFLFDNLKTIAEWRPSEHRWKQSSGSNKGGEEEKKEVEPYVVQRYVTNPLLIGGRKFDLRLYVLVPSFSPLVVYLYRSGFARFSGSRFSMSSSDLENIAIHLTNVAVQKHQENYDERRGGKWDLQHLKSYLYTAYPRDQVNKMFHEIQNVVLKSLLCVQPAIINDKHCFELYGFDILIDSCLKPWLLEANSSPSLTATTQEDYELKFGLLDDCLSVLDPEHFFSGNLEEQVGGFDLIYRGGVKIEPPGQATYKTYLGCFNDRREQLKRLARALATRQQVEGSSGTATGGASGAGNAGSGSGTGTGSSHGPGSGSGAGNNDHKNRRISNSAMSMYGGIENVNKRGGGMSAGTYGVGDVSKRGIGQGRKMVSGGSTGKP